MAGFDQFLPDVLVLATRVRGTRSHNKTGSAGGVQVRVEILNPQIVGVADRFGLAADARQIKRQASGRFALGRVDVVDVERRIGHHVVALATKCMLVLVERVALRDLRLQPVDRHVHPGQPDRGVGLLLSVERNRFVSVSAFPLDKVARLHEHAAAAAGRVEHRAVRWFDHIDDRLNKRHGREELTAFLSPRHGELVQEVFVDAAEDVARGLLQSLAVKDAKQLPQQCGLEPLVLLRQRTFEAFVFGLDRLHGIGQSLPDVFALRQTNQPVEPGIAGQKDGVLLEEIVLLDRPLLPATRRQVRLDLLANNAEPIERMAQEDQPQHWHAVLGRGQLRVSP